jgi:hypothetical protein
MARNVTLSTLRDDIANQVDVTVGASGRYTPTYLTRLVNQSIQRFRERVSSEGMAHFLVSTTGTLTAGATSPYSFSELDLSSVSPSVVRTYGVDITVNGCIVSLAHRPFTERNDHGGPQNTGIPRAWMHYQTRKLAIAPAPDSAYAYAVWYLPVLADLSADGDTFDGVAGWEEYVVWDVCLRLITRDQYATAHALFTQNLERTWQDILRGASKVTAAGGANVGRDTFGGYGSPYARGQRGLIAAGGGTPATHSVTNAMLAEIPEETIKGRARGAGYGDVQNLTPGQAAGAISVFSGFSAGLVPTGTGQTTTFLRNDGTWVAPSVGGSVSGLELSQIQNLSSPRVVGRFSVGTGAPEQLTGQQVASMIGVFTGAAHGLAPRPTGGAAGLFLRDDSTWAATTAPTGIALAQLAAIPATTILGRTSPSGIPEALTPSAVATMMPLFNDVHKGLVPGSAGGTTNFLRADGTWNAPPAAGTPTGIELAQLAAIPATTILGRTSPSGIPQALTPSTVATMMPLFNDVHKGLVPGSSGGTTNFLRADGTWATPPGGAGGGGPTMLAAAPANAVQYNGGSGFAGASGLLFNQDTYGLQLARNFRQPTGVMLLGATGVDAAPVGWIGAYSGAINFGIGTGLLEPAFTIETPPDAAGFVRFRSVDMGGAGSPRTLFSVNRNVASGNIVGTFGSNDYTSVGLHSRHGVLVRGAGPTGFIQFGLGTNLTEAFAARPGHHTWSVSGAQKMGLDNDGLSVWGQLGVQQRAHSASTDKLATWTASGFANVATGITLGASGYSLSVGSGGPVLHASGADFRSSSIENVKRINGLDGIKIYGFVSGGGAASGSQNILAPSGTAFVIPASVTAGQVFNLVSSGAANGDLVMLENRSGVTHRANNVGSPSGFLSNVVPSGGTTFRFGSGAWSLQHHVQFG